MFENVSIKQEVKRKLDEVVNNMSDLRMREFWTNETKNQRIKYGLGDRLKIGEMKLSPILKSYLDTLYDTTTLVYSNRAYLNYQGNYKLKKQMKI